MGWDGMAVVFWSIVGGKLRCHDEENLDRSNSMQTEAR